MNNEAFSEAIRAIESKIEVAAKRVGRDSRDVTLIAASKTVSSEAILSAVAAGVRVFGENRVQEAIKKFSTLPVDRSLYALHLIGSLQMNKVKKAVGFFDLIHSIDAISLAEKVNQEAERQSLTQAILVQVNVGDEVSKGGVSIPEFPYLIDAIGKMSHLKLLGLMAIPPAMKDPRPYFAQLRGMGESCGFIKLSMGMSSDFEVAIEEGASWVRVGTALFGTRR
ncbi:MAG: YggS family pyridoxal phosphate-dependent enzyme [Nitrospirota bacterium]